MEFTYQQALETFCEEEQPLECLPSISSVTDLELPPDEPLYVEIQRPVDWLFLHEFTDISKRVSIKSELVEAQATFYKLRDELAYWRLLRRSIDAKDEKDTSRAVRALQDDFKVPLDDQPYRQAKEEIDRLEIKLNDENDPNVGGLIKETDKIVSMPAMRNLRFKQLDTEALLGTFNPIDRTITIKLNAITLLAGCRQLQAECDDATFDDLESDLRLFALFHEAIHGHLIYGRDSDGTTWSSFADRSMQWHEALATVYTLRLAKATHRNRKSLRAVADCVVRLLPKEYAAFHHLNRLSDLDLHACFRDVKTNSDMPRLIEKTDILLSAIHHRISDLREVLAIEDQRKLREFLEEAFWELSDVLSGTLADSERKQGFDKYVASCRGLFEFFEKNRPPAMDILLDQWPTPTELSVFAATDLCDGEPLRKANLGLRLDLMIRSAQEARRDIRDVFRKNTSCIGYSQIVEILRMLSTRR